MSSLVLTLLPGRKVPNNEKRKDPPSLPASLTPPLAPSTQPRRCGGGRPGGTPHCASGARGRWSIPVEFLGAGAPGLGSARSTCQATGTGGQGSGDSCELARSPPQRQNKSTHLPAPPRPARRPIAGRGRGVGGAGAAGRGQSPGCCPSRSPSGAQQPSLERAQPRARRPCPPPAARARRPCPPPPGHGLSDGSFLGRHRHGE